MPFRPCHIPKLTAKQTRLANQLARAEAPHRYGEFVAGMLAVERRSWWGDKGKKFGVAFSTGTAPAMRDRVLARANNWSNFANVEFIHDPASPIVRVGFKRGDGHWSYLGTDLLGIPAGERTMNLELSMRDSDEEFERVVDHEFGHTIGCPHEHMRSELVARIDVRKAERYFLKTQGWDSRTVREQVLTPVSEKSLFGTEHADEESIMCYQLPGEITIDGKPIKGGDRINANDAAFIASIYPKTSAPPIVLPPPVGEVAAEYVLDGVRYRVTKVGAA